MKTLITTAKNIIRKSLRLEEPKELTEEERREMERKKLINSLTFFSIFGIKL
jgi:hypothetical protein